VEHIVSGNTEQGAYSERGVNMLLELIVTWEWTVSGEKIVNGE
jgi:hypothetical protein